MDKFLKPKYVEDKYKQVQGHKFTKIKRGKKNNGKYLDEDLNNRFT